MAHMGHMANNRLGGRVFNASSMSALGDAGAKAQADHLCAEEQTNNSFVVHIVRTAAQICAYWRPSHYTHRLNVEFRLLLKHDSEVAAYVCVRFVCVCL